MFTVHILATSPQFVTNEEVNFPLSLFLTHNHGQLFPLQIITDQNTVFSPTILLNHSTYTLQYYQIIHSIYKIIPSISFTCNTCKKNKIKKNKKSVILYTNKSITSYRFAMPGCFLIPSTIKMMKLSYMLRGKQLIDKLHTNL